MNTPSQPDSAQSEPEPPESTLLLERAEQAVLGAILLDPEQLRLLQHEKLTPEHFHKPIHRAIYQSAIDLHGSKTASSLSEATAWPTAVLSRARRYAKGLNTTYLYRLTHACHRTTHAPAYAAIVREGATRRLIIQAALRLEQAAQNGATSRVITTAEPLITHLLHNPPRPDHPVDLPVDASQGPYPTDDEVELLATLTHHPQQIPHITGVLHPSDFSNPTTAQLYRSLTALAHRGEPIDPLTVHWEMHRGTALSADTIAILDAITTHRGGSAPFLAERLLHSSLLRTATHTAGSIHADTANESIPLRAVTDKAQAPLALLSHAIRRWTSGGRADRNAVNSPPLRAKPDTSSSAVSPRETR